MNNFKSSNALAIAAIALIIGGIIWVVNTNRINNSLEAGLQEQKLKSEALLSEKLLLEKDIDRFKDQLSKMKGENSDLNNLVKLTSAQLKGQELDYHRMKKENMSLNQVRKQRQELQALKSQLENEITLLKTSYANMEAKNNELINLVASLQERNKILSDDLNRAMLAAVDQSQIHAVKGKNEKLTINARRTKKLIANFEVPANLKNLGFRIKDAKGNALTSDAGNIAFTAVPSNQSFIASSSGEVEGSKLQNVEMVYIPKQKLRTGVYTIEILNDNLYVGSLKVKLK